MRAHHASAGMRRRLCRKRRLATCLRPHPPHARRFVANHASMTAAAGERRYREHEPTDLQGPALDKMHMLAAKSFKKLGCSQRA